MTQQLLTRPEVILWSNILLGSYEKLLKRPLIARCGDMEREAYDLFNAPMAVVSHGIESDPVLNYGNKTALGLWETDWDKFVTTPSRLTAEAANREERARMLQQAQEQGYIDNYRGIRISTTGNRFAIWEAIVWNLYDPAGNRLGQAATFANWEFV